MKRFLIFTTLALLLAACTADDSDALVKEETIPYEMKFNFVTYSLSRATPGVYSGSFNKEDISLSSYFTDNIGNSQFYFEKLNGDDFSENGSVWTANGWYWPLQGKMTLFNYWTSVTSGSELIEIENPDGTKVPALKVDGSNLDGYHDFVYGCESGIDCPQASAVTLPCYHALSWLKLRVYTYVYQDGGVKYDKTKSETLRDRLTVHKISVEDCSRKGEAIITPAHQVTWNIPNSSYIKDQLYTLNSSTNNFEWKEVSDASSENVSSTPITVTAGSTRVPILNSFQGTSNQLYQPWGLLIVPQRKTAIVIDYTLKLDNNREIRRSERFELRENGYWLPGSEYKYDIIFRNYSDLGVTFDFVEDWTELDYSTSNQSFSNGAFGSFFVNENGTQVELGTEILIDPMHDGGSALGDDMDYKKGGTVF